MILTIVFRSMVGLLGGSKIDTYIEGRCFLHRILITKKRGNKMIKTQINKTNMKETNNIYLGVSAQFEIEKVFIPVA